MIDVRIAAGEIETLLRSQIPADKMQGFVGEVGEIETPPNDDRVKAYWILYAGPGQVDGSRIVPAKFVDRLTFNLTVAGGTEDRALFGVGLVRAALCGEEIGSGLISEQPFDPGSLRVDKTVTPSRHFTLLSYLLEP